MAVGDLVTPHGVLLQDAGAPREEWLAERRKGIGSSDLPAVMGMTEYGSALRVYYDKRGVITDDDAEHSEPAHFGKLYEGPLAFDWARRNRTVIEPVGIGGHRDDPWQRCSLDRLCAECPLNRRERRICAVEVKHRDKMLAKLWRQGPADDALVQTLWQALVTGLDHIHVVCCIGGNDYRQYVVRIAEHTKLVALLDATAARLWWEHIVPGIPPELTGNEPPDDLIKLYDQLHPERAGAIELDRDLDAQDVVTEYLIAVKDASDAEKRRKSALARMIGRLGESQMALFDQRPFYSLEPTLRRHIDLQRLQEEFPAAYTACVKDKPGTKIYIPNRIREEFGR